jgi:DNA-binding transcriptional MocR family regulator
MNAPVPRAAPLIDAYSLRIVSGELKPGTKLPSVRALMNEHGVALATAHRVYAALDAAGLVVGEAGRGTFVRDASVPRSNAIRQRLPSLEDTDLSFNYPTLPDQEAALREALRRLAGRGDLDALLHAPPHGGRPHERDTAARHLRNRGIRLPASQVLMVNGAQHGLCVAVQALLRPGDRVAVDALTYPGFKSLAQAQRIELCGLPQTDGAMDLDALERLCQRRRVRAVYAMPTLHNPLGAVMAEAQRRRLAELAERHDLLLIEDGAYAFLGEPAPPPLACLAPERTVYVCGLSKSVSSGLRVGFLAAPAAWMPALEEAVRITAWSTPAITVALACDWIESGHVDHLEARKRADARRRQRIAREVLAGLRCTAHPASYFVWLELPAQVRAERVAQALLAQRIVVATADAFSAKPQVPQALRLAIGSTPLPQLRRALSAVVEAVDAVERAAG